MIADLEPEMDTNYWWRVYLDHLSFIKASNFILKDALLLPHVYGWVFALIQCQAKWIHFILLDTVCRGTTNKLRHQLDYYFKYLMNGSYSFWVLVCSYGPNPILMLVLGSCPSIYVYQSKLGKSQSFDFIFCH